MRMADQMSRDEYLAYLKGKGKGKGTRTQMRFPKAISQEKRDINTQLILLEAAKNIPKFHTEYRFHEKRRWRFDWAIPMLKLAIEYEGIFSEKSRHTSVKGYTRDTEKYNAAAKDGWTVLRYTADNYRNCGSDILDYLQKTIAECPPKPKQ